MDRRNLWADINSDPLCKFGPGGDFVKDWSVGRVKLTETDKNPVSTILAMIAGMLGTAVRAEILMEEAEPEKTGNCDFGKEKTSGAGKQRNIPNHTEAARRAKADSELRKEPMLFSDDRGIGTTVGHKPKYRIRTCRRSSRKGASDSVKGQGTLFEINGAGQSAA